MVLTVDLPDLLGSQKGPCKAWAAPVSGRSTLASQTILPVAARSHKLVWIPFSSMPLPVGDSLSLQAEIQMDMVTWVSSENI